MPKQAEGEEGVPTPFDARLAAIVTLSDDALLTVDTNQLVTFLNPAAERILGFAAADLVGQSIEILIPIRHREAHRRHLADFVSATQPQDNMVPIGPITVLRNGGEEFAAESSVGSFAVNGEAILVVRLRKLGATFDAPALAITRERLESIVAVSDDAMYSVDSAQTFTAFNRAAETMFGYRSREVIGKQVDLLIPKRMRRTYVGRFQTFISSDEAIYRRTVVDPVILARKDGSEFHVDLAATKFLVAGDRAVAFRLRDVTAAVDGTVLARSQARLAGIINISEDAILTVDESQRITLFNPAAERIFGYEGEDILGEPIGKLIPAGAGKGEQDHVRNFILSREQGPDVSLSGSITAVRRNGEVFPAEASAARFTLGRDQILTLRLRDVTEKVKADELRVQLLAAEESALLKTRLLSTVSHELRSPLAAILGFTSVLIDYNDRLDEADRMQQLTVIQDSTRHLQKIVDDLLELSRLEAGVLQVELRPVALRTLVDAAITMLGPTPTHGLKIRPKDVPQTILGDPARLLQVLTNLLDNAVKYSPNGTEIEIQTRNAGAFAEVTVRDHGPGVPMEDIERIFDAFFRTATAHATPNIKGTGLGLAICRGILEAHGGLIKATLPPDGGLAITLALPLAPFESSKPGTL